MFKKKENTTVGMDKPKKPFYKKWWFYVLVVFVVFGMIGSCGQDPVESAKSKILGDVMEACKDLKNDDGGDESIPFWIDFYVKDKAIILSDDEKESLEKAVIDEVNKKYKYDFDEDFFVKKGLTYLDGLAKVNRAPGSKEEVFDILDNDCYSSGVIDKVWDKYKDTDAGKKAIGKLKKKETDEKKEQKKSVENRDEITKITSMGEKYLVKSEYSVSKQEVTNYLMKNKPENCDGPDVANAMTSFDVWWNINKGSMPKSMQFDSLWEACCVVRAGKLIDKGSISVNDEQGFIAVLEDIGFTEDEIGTAYLYHYMNSAS